MNEQSQNSNQSESTKSKPKNDYLRVSREIRKKVISDLAALNRKSYGKQITLDQYVGLAISLITDEHREKLRDQSITNQDRIELLYRQHCESNGKISMDQFLGILLAERKA